MKKNLNFLIKKPFSSILSMKNIEFYNENGYFHIKNLFSKEKINKLKEEAETLMKNQDPNELSFAFNGGSNLNQDYFLKSGDKVRFFLEDQSFDENGRIKLPLIDCVNKIGHGLHDFNQVFKEFSYSKEILNIIKSIGYVNPMIIMSMYILKSKRIGGEVTPHTDNTYIRTSPLSCMGIWVALDDATVENGAMYGVPGSNKNKTDYFMKLVTEKDGRQRTVYNKDKQEYSIEGAVPLEAKQGDVILLHGDFVHFSYKNESEKRRHAYTLHLVEGKSGFTWEKDNWLQREGGFNRIEF